MNSNATNINTTQWKEGQSISQTCVPYKLFNHSSVLGNQIPPANSPRTLITPLNGIVAVPTPTNSSILSPKTNITRLYQQQYVSPLSLVHCQNLGAHPVIRERMSPKMGSQWKTQ